MLPDSVLRTIWMTRMMKSTRDMKNTIPRLLRMQPMRAQKSNPR